MQPGRFRQQIGKSAGGGQHLLEIIQHQEQTTTGKGAYEYGERRPVLIERSEARRHRRQHEGRISHGSEVYQHPLGEGISEAIEQGERQTGLSHSCRPDQRQQRRLSPLEQRGQLGKLLFASDERLDQSLRNLRLRLQARRRDQCRAAVTIDGGLERLPVIACELQRLYQSVYRVAVGGMALPLLQHRDGRLAQAGAFGQRGAGEPGGAPVLLRHAAEGDAVRNDHRHTKGFTCLPPSATFAPRKAASADLGQLPGERVQDRA